MTLSGRLLMVAVALALGVAGCGLLTPRTDQTRFAVLASVDDLPGASPKASDPAASLQIGLGPITLPDYLRRAAIVTREDGTRLIPSTTESWAEPFERSVERVLEINLRRAPKVSSVTLHPWYETERPQVQVEIAFSRCERDTTAGVVVAARWRIRWLDGSRPPLEQETRFERPSATANGSEVAKAISEALAELCNQIAEAL